MKTLRITILSFLLVSFIGLESAKAQINPQDWPKEFWIDRTISLLETHTWSVEFGLQEDHLSNRRAALHAQILAEDWDAALKTAKAYSNAFYSFYQRVYKSGKYNHIPDFDIYIEQAMMWLGGPNKSPFASDYLTIIGGLEILKNWP